MSNSCPLVTVYIATHNRSSLLIRALNSVFNQTYPNIEIIVADDGSTDDTERVLQPFVRDNRISYLKNPSPKGACFVRNLAINQSNGLYITGLDDDDEFAQDRVEQLVRHFDESKFSCVTSTIRERTPQGDICRSYDTGIVTLNDMLHYDVLGNQVLTKTEYLQAIGGFDENLPAFQDYDTWVRLVAQFGPGKKLKKPTYVLYSDHGLQRISENNNKRLNGFNIFYQKHSDKMNAKHHDSMKLLEKRLKREPYLLREFIALTHYGNWVSSVSYFINTNFQWVRQLFYSLRVR